jgi:hypothetical protein
VMLLGMLVCDWALSAHGPANPSSSYLILLLCCMQPWQGAVNTLDTLASSLASSPLPQQVAGSCGARQHRLILSRLQDD